MIDTGTISVVELPPADPGALRQAAGFFDTAASSLTQVASRMSAVTAGVAGSSWQGQAARVWERMGRAQIDDLHRATRAFGEAMDTLRTLAAAIESAQDTAARANSDGRDAHARRQAALARATALAQPPPPDGEYRAELGRAESAGRQALDDFQQASRSAAASLQAIAAAAPTVAPVPGPAVPLQFGSNAPSFLTLLLGSVTDNRLAGITFQETVLQDLGLPENFMLVPPELLLARARPDAITETDLYEIKSVAYQARTGQIRVQLRYARDEGLRFNLIVRRSTRISQPLRNRIQLAGGRIFRRQGNGLYTGDDGSDGAAPEVYRCSNGDFERVDLAPKALTDPSGDAGGRAGRGTGDNGIRDEPSPNDPVAPEEDVPEMPEPEIFPLP